MGSTGSDEPHYVPVLVRADLRERAEREIASVGPAPKQRESLDVTDPEHIDRLPSNVLWVSRTGNWSNWSESLTFGRVAPSRLRVALASKTTTGLQSLFSPNLSRRTG